MIALKQKSGNKSKKKRGKTLKLRDSTVKKATSGVRKWTVSSMLLWNEWADPSFDQFLSDVNLKEFKYLFHF